MDIYKSGGLRGRVYYVFDKKTNPDQAIIEAARESKNARADMEACFIWIKDDGKGYTDVYTTQTRGAIKMLAVIRKPRKGRT